MKKDYISPLATEVYIETENLLDGSFVGVGEGQKDPTDALSSERRGTWGDLWAK